jgi:hypothetical protein
MHRAMVERGGRGGLPVDPERLALEQRQMARIGQLLRPDFHAWALDYPFHETGLNARGGAWLALFIGPEGATFRGPIDGYTEVCRASTWDELEVGVADLVRAGAPWGRGVGQRDAVYASVMAERIERGESETDAEKLAIDTADAPFTDLDTFLCWCRAAPAEVVDSDPGRRMLEQLDLTATITAAATEARETGAWTIADHGEMENIGRMHDSDEAHLRAVAAFALHTMMRADEVLHIKWSDIDTESGKVRIPPIRHRR